MIIRVVGAVKRRKREMNVSLNKCLTLWKAMLLTKPLQSQ
jgi:hypothetical protein